MSDPIIQDFWQEAPAEPQLFTTNLEDDDIIRTIEEILHDLGIIKDNGDLAIANNDPIAMQRVAAQLHFS